MTDGGNLAISTAVMDHLYDVGLYFDIQEQQTNKICTEANQRKWPNVCLVDFVSHHCDSVEMCL